MVDLTPPILQGQRLGVRTYNQISPVGLARFDPARYEVGADVADPAAMLLRSADLHGMVLPTSLRAIGRAGAGTNNIPVQACSALGIPVFNAPGANANAVKELVLAGMLMALRHVAPALRFVANLDGTAPDLDERVEAGKKAFAGRELAGRTLGVIGLGRIGCNVADAAIKLGMQVLGFDPEITVDAAWSLPSQVRRAANVAEVLRGSDLVSLHVPLVAATRGLIGAEQLAMMRSGSVLLNFSRDGVVDNRAVVRALDNHQLDSYVCDFPSVELNLHPRVIALPHLGASTAEAEDNCALMVADQLIDYLEHGEIRHAVNFPSVQMPRESAWRVAIANANVPNMLGQISTTMAQHGLNIHNMVNKSRGEMAYTLVDVDSQPPAGVLQALGGIEGVLMVRNLPAPAAGSTR
jgi:D-3-phosphoglycerate dehydrogenase